MSSPVKFLDTTGECIRLSFELVSLEITFKTLILPFICGEGYSSSREFTRLEKRPYVFKKTEALVFSPKEIHVLSLGHSFH